MGGTGHKTPLPVRSVRPMRPGLPGRQSPGTGTGTDADSVLLLSPFCCKKSTQNITLKKTAQDRLISYFPLPLRPAAARGWIVLFKK